jgi:hypothetical protein
MEIVDKAIFLVACGLLLILFLGGTRRYRSKKP